METVGVDPGIPVNVLQDPQQKASKVIAWLTLIIRLVNVPVVMVQGEPDGNVSCPAQLSNENLYSVVPGNMLMVVVQIPSLLVSVIGAQLPHQLLKIPLTFGVVKPVMPFMFT